MTDGAPTRKLRVFFPEHQAERPSTQFAFACGLGTRLEGDYVFVRDGSLAEFRARGQQYFECVESCEQADLVSYPHKYEPGKEADRAAEVARRGRLPCVFFRNTDRPRPTHLGYGVIFQESLFASRRTSCERPHPAVVDDLAIGLTPGERVKKAKPVVSFRGFRGTGMHRELLRWLILGNEAFLGSHLRKRAVRHCERSPQVETSFEFLRFGRIYENRDKLRELYIRNIRESDYVLAIRGAGNYSYRLYETLCLGRIPVCLNTDSVLPLTDVVDWRRHCVWIEPDDFHRIPDRIREFHDSLSPDDFTRLQRDNRSLWENDLEATAFWRRALWELVGSSTPEKIGSRP